MNVRLEKESEVQNISKAELKAGKHSFVFDKFDKNNATQTYVCSATCYGLPLISTIVDRQNPVMIRKTSTVFGTAFKDMVVCASNISSSLKKEFSALVEAMNGTYQADLTANTTHLITNTTLTKKYEEAVRRKISIYHIDWLNKVHQDISNAQYGNFKADDDKYVSYILPTFFELTITTTGIVKDERESIRNAVEEHGGTFSETFLASKISVLIVGNEAFNEKYVHAQTAKIPCLKPEWIRDSVEGMHTKIGVKEISLF